MMSHDVLLIRTLIQGKKPSLKVTSWNELAKIRRASTPPNKNKHDSRNTTVWVDVTAIGQIMGEKNRPESHRKVFRGYNRCKSNLQVQMIWVTNIDHWLTIPWRIHETNGIFLPTWRGVIFKWDECTVGKYASPMDPMGMIFACVCFKYCPKCFSGYWQEALFLEVIAPIRSTFIDYFLVLLILSVRFAPFHNSKIS